ncbi:hypothetical protein [Chitinimonas sp.]|uniref:hypothetical protein n=1 Tax=Chitinimonas sp. TaxID=1934313 RepID=UPI0035B4BFEF
MFVLSKKPTIKWPAKIKAAVEGGAIKEYQFDLIFKKLDADQVELLNQVNETVEGESIDQQVEKTAAKIEGWLDGWTGIKNEDGTDIEFSPENVRLILKSHFGPAWQLAFYTALGEVRTGQRAKN